MTDLYYTPSTYIVDRDTATMVLEGHELTADRVRPVVDAIARRLEAALAEAGKDHVLVVREYRLTARCGTAEVDPRLIERVLVGQVDEIRAEVLGEAASLYRCRCDALGMTQERCGYLRAPGDLVTVEVMPEDARVRHEAAGYRCIAAAGSYPVNGSIRASVASECAEELLAEHGDWARVID